MMRTLLTVLLFVSVTAFGQVKKKISEQTTFVSGGQFKGVIFSADYELPMFDDADKSRFTPTMDEIMKFEKELGRRIKEINKNRPNQGRHYGPIIDKNLGKYTRQYAGFINDKGERIIHAGLNWKRNDQEWKNDFILVYDGGSYHSTIRYNLDKNEFFHFSVNGVAGVPNSSQQNVYAMRAFGVKLKLMFHGVVRSPGTIRSMSGLTFRCASFLSPPIPHTA